MKYVMRKELSEKIPSIKLWKKFSGKSGFSQIYTNHYVHLSAAAHLYQAQQELIVSKYVPLQNIKVNQLCLIKSAQYLINRKEMPREFYQAHLYLVQQIQWNSSQPQHCQSWQVQHHLHVMR